MKQETTATRILNFLKQVESATPKQIIDGLSGSATRATVYTVLGYLKRTKRVEKIGRKYRIARKQMADKPKDGSNNTIKALRAEVEQLSDWCLEWRRKYDAIDEDRFRLRERYQTLEESHKELTAVIRYLESKMQILIQNLLEGKHDNRK